ncbi:phage/plasmid primase, P4 family [Methylobacterium sp. J-077]|uniref:phage/plasmid primase, P4 family n=1 Tax=Methylobacterium sp. J-077 TaxID=2836656 RepID=UPI001FB8EE03|nr:phage/plasmid primase, P4 family [Methylobacterium sp. J-077]MCJ2122087.1 phage/plasmid primase, P4 family [Methylobacterium sp. J-077]
MLLGANFNCIALIKIAGLLVADKDACLKWSSKLNIDYNETHFSYIPLHSKTKKPVQQDWQNKGEELKSLLNFGSIPSDINVGVLTGTASGGLVDIDLDGSNTTEAAALILPPTGLVFGRDSKPGSHYLFRITGDTRTVKLTHPVSGKMLVEFRGDGCQTMMVGSVHPDGEAVRYEAGKDGVPSWVQRDDLLRAVRQIATVSVLSEFWVQGGRHKLALRFAGLCACSEVNQESCLTVVQTLCDITDDEEMDDRIGTVVTTYERAADQKPVEWRSKLIKLFGSEKALNTLIEWMGGRQTASKAIAVNNNTRTVSVTIDTSTDISTAEAFHESTIGSLIYAEHEERFYKNSSEVYDPISPVEVKATIIDFLKEPARTNTISDPVKIRASQSSARINSVYELSESLKRTDDRGFNAHSHLIGTRNGVLDLSVQRLITPNDIITKRIGTDFRADASCPKFLDFISQVFNGDIEKIEYVRRAVGYTLTGSVEAQIMFILIGAGANGKSVFLSLLQALMGDYGTALPAHSIMQQKFSNDKTDDLASLVGKRFAYATEGESGDRLAVAKIKRMTGGDMMSVKRLYKDYFNMRPEFKLWFASNELPQISGNDDAIWRRIHVIEFPRTFKPEERDPKLLEKLKGELPGILNWSLEGLEQIGEMKGDFLAPPESVRHSIAEYRSENNNVADFIDAACVRDGVSKIMAGELYERYVSYSDNSGSEPLNKIMFMKTLTRMDIGIHKRANGNARTGIRFK